MYICKNLARVVETNYDDDDDICKDKQNRKGAKRRSFAKNWCGNNKNYKLPRLSST